MESLNKIREYLDQTYLGINLFNLVLAVFAFLLVLVVHSIFEKVVCSYLKKISQKNETSVNENLIYSLKPAIQILFLILGLWIFSIVLGVPKDEMLIIERFVRTLILVDLFYALFKIIDIASFVLKTKTILTDNGMNVTLINFLNKIVKFITVLIAVMTLLEEWDYNVSAIIAGLGVGGIAIGLAAKDSVANIFGSITILTDRPFCIGDWIKTVNIEGIVEDIGLRSTKVRAFDRSLVVIPNSVIANDSIINFSKMEKRRVKFKLGLTYNSNSFQIEELTGRIKGLLINNPEIHQNDITVNLTDFGASSLEITISFFTITTECEKYLETQQDIKLKIMKIVEDLNLSIAWPT